jgi:hypothetical protein
MMSLLIAQLGVAAPFVVSSSLFIFPFIRPEQTVNVRGGSVNKQTCQLTTREARISSLLNSVTITSNESCVMISNNNNKSLHAKERFLLPTQRMCTAVMSIVCVRGSKWVCASSVTTLLVLARVLSR